MLKVGINGVCPAKGVSMSQMAGVTCQYLRDKPAERQRDGADLTMEALMAAFPCDEQ